MTPNLNIQPDIKISLKQSFGIDSEMEVDAFSEKSEYVPEIDKNYKFDRDTTLAIVSGFAHNKRVLVQGYHGTGKSTHIEQIAARLNWPCIRVNLDSHISRIDLIGKDAIVLKEGKQVTQFNEGILPWSIQNPVALVFDEYDAGRQREAEARGLSTTVITFEPLPGEFLFPEKAPPRLMTFREKFLALEVLGIDHLLCLRFNDDLRTMSPRAFVERNY